MSILKGNETYNFKMTLYVHYLHASSSWSFPAIVLEVSSANFVAGEMCLEGIAQKHSAWGWNNPFNWFASRRMKLLASGI